MPLKRTRSSTVPILHTSGAATTGDSFQMSVPSSAGPARLQARRGRAARKVGIPQSVIVQGIYNYLRFLKASGTHQVDLEDVAQALGLPLSVVQEAIPKLKRRGVRLAK